MIKIGEMAFDLVNFKILFAKMNRVAICSIFFMKWEKTSSNQSIDVLQSKRNFLFYLH